MAQKKKIYITIWIPNMLQVLTSESNNFRYYSNVPNERVGSLYSLVKCLRKMGINCTRYTYKRIKSTAYESEFFFFWCTVPLTMHNNQAGRHVML